MKTEPISWAWGGSSRTCRLALSAAVALLSGWASSALAQGAMAPAAQTPFPFTLGKVFTFLFLTLGPFHVIGPFVEMTRGRDETFRRRLAFQGVLIAALGLLAAAVFGVRTLNKWGVSPAAVFIATGILFFLTALRVVMAQYKPRPHEAALAHGDPEPARSVASLAFSPLAFPTIVTPYGIAVLVLAMRLASAETATALQILAITALVLAADLVAMLAAHSALKPSPVASAFGLVGSVMAVLQIALGVQAIIVGLRLLGVVA